MFGVVSCMINLLGEQSSRIDAEMIFEAVNSIEYGEVMLIRLLSMSQLNALHVLGMYS